jgi:flagellar biosynthetic protein FlhB
VLRELAPTHHKERQWPTNKTIPKNRKNRPRNALDEALQRGDVVKSQEVNTWFVLGAATLVLLSFSGEMSSGINGMLRAFLSQAHAIPVDGRGLHRHHAEARDRHDRGGRAPARNPGARGACRQHGAAPAGVVGREPEAEALQSIARGRFQAAVLQDCADELRERPDQARADRRDHDGDPVAEAQPTRRPGHDGSGSRAAAHATLSLDVLGAVVAMLAIIAAADYLFQYRQWAREAEDVAAGDEGGVQADRRRSGDQGQDPAACAWRG